MKFAYFSGRRVRDKVLQLTWRTVDFEAGTVRLEPGTIKNKDGRVIYMAPQVKEVLSLSWATTKLLQRDRGEILQLVFHNADKPIADYYKQWHRACRAAGVAGKILHDRRRAAVRNMVRAGIPERVAMQTSGHKTRSVFDRYHIVSDGDLKEAAEKPNSVRLGTIAGTGGEIRGPKDGVDS